MDKREIEAFLAKLRKEYDAAIKATKKGFSVKQRVLSECLSDQVDLVQTFEAINAQANYLEKEAEALRDISHSFAYSKIIKGPHKVMSNDARKLADCDDHYVDAVVLYNQVYKFRKEIEAVNNTITARGYTLKSHTDALKAGVDKAIL